MCRVHRLTPMSRIEFFNDTLGEEVHYERFVMSIDKAGVIRKPRLLLKDATHLLLDPLTNSAGPCHARSPGA